MDKIICATAVLIALAPVASVLAATEMPLVYSVEDTGAEAVRHY